MHNGVKERGRKVMISLSLFLGKESRFYSSVTMLYITFLSLFLCTLLDSVQSLGWRHYDEWSHHTPQFDEWSHHTPQFQRQTNYRRFPGWPIRRRYYDDWSQHTPQFQIQRNYKQSLGWPFRRYYKCYDWPHDTHQPQGEKKVESRDWTHNTVLDGDAKYHLSWTPSVDRRGERNLTFKVEVKAKGYFGLGFSPNGGMPGSDIVTGWIKDGVVYFQDRYADAFSLPKKDDSQDYELINAYENDTFTVFEFSRKLDTCDKDDMVINESTMRVIYAFSDEDPTGDDPFYHRQNRGSKSIMLLQNNVNKGQAAPNLNSLLTWDIRSPDIDISSLDTLYWCKVFRSPQVSKKHHMVYVKPLIQEGHEQFVHHILLYECVGGTPAEYEEYLDYRGHQCYHPNMPTLMRRCQGVTLAWAVGGEDLAFPEHVGLPIEPAPGKYYMFEIHYDNPQLRTGIVDHSGLRIYYTPDLRKFDAGNFLVGASILPRVFIPPGQKEYVVAAHSTPECMNSAFPRTGIKVLGILLHAHLLGRAIKVRHFRGNRELPPLADDRNYDFNYQEYRLFPAEVDILPGDQITVECTYDSTKRPNVTLGGISTTEEMCMAFLLYYPLVSQHLTLSAPDLDTFNEIFKTKVTNEEEVTYSLMTYNWTNADIPEVQKAMRYSNHVTQCRLERFPQEGEKILASYPRFLIPYEAERSCSFLK